MSDSPSTSVAQAGAGVRRLPARSRALRRLVEIITPVAAIAVALLVSALLLIVAGFSPIEAYTVMWNGAFGDLRAFTEVLIKATPLILIGSGLAVAFRCNIWNIGAEGQFYAGAVVATVIGVTVTTLPPALMIPLVLVAGAAAGALWGMLAGYLRNRFGASEIITTIMLNYVAIIGTGYLVTGPIIDTASKYPQSAKIVEAAWLPRFLPPTRLHIGFLIALLVAVALYLLIFHTSIGYAIRAVGINPEAARYAGMSVERNVLLAMGISGGTAGLAGAIEVAGISFRLYQQISPGYGFEGIAVALLANNHPLGIILSGILFGALRSGSEVMQVTAHIPSVLVLCIQGLVILSVVAFETVRQRARRRELAEE